MNIRLYWSTDNYIDIELASVGPIEPNSQMLAFSQIQDMSGQWAQNVDYNTLGITLGTKLNALDVTSPDPDPLYLMAGPSDLMVL